MKRLLLSITVASMLFSTSCKRHGFCKKGKDPITTETREVDNFTGINSQGSYDVHISQDESLKAGQVRIEAPSDMFEFIETDVSGDILTITNKRCFRGDNNIHVYTSSKEVNNISLSGSGNVNSETDLVTTTMNLEISGSGSIECDVIANKLNAKISGSGDIETYGDIDNQDLVIKGSGNIKNFNIESLIVSTTIDGSGNIEVSVSEKLDVDIDGSGEVRYKGSPTITQDITGSGSVISMN